MVEKTEALRLNEQQKLNVLPARRAPYEPPSLEFIPLVHGGAAASVHQT